MKKDWRYFEQKMNKCFEAGDKERALAYKEKFISLYRRNQTLVGFPRVPKVYNLDALTDIRFQKELTAEEREKIRKRTIVFDWNKFKEDYDILLNSLEGYLKKKGYVVPVKEFDSPWELVDIVSERLFNEGEGGVLENALQRGDIEALARLITDAMDEGTSSNADKLSEASDWMDKIMKAITKPDTPTNREIIEIFYKYYPGFKLEYDFNSIKFAKGMKLQKVNISKALAFIYEKKHPGKSITGDAIRKRYNKRNYW